MRRYVRHAERGVVLLEVMIATALLGIAGTSLIALLAQALRDEQRLRDRERAMDAAERVLVAQTLLARDDLDRRIGRYQMGAFMADVQRPRPVLYRIAVSDTAAPEVEMLVTVVYRPEPKR